MRHPYSTFAYLFCWSLLSYVCAAQSLIFIDQPATNSQAREICISIGLVLADINSSNVLEAFGLIEQKRAWVRSWNGDSYNDRCLVMQGTSIVVGACIEALPFLCSAPGISTATSSGSTATTSMPDSTTTASTTTHFMETVLYYFPTPLSNADAAADCVSRGLVLADIDIMNVEAASLLTNGQLTWIRSWNGDDYAPDCIAEIWTAVINQSCTDKHPYICQGRSSCTSTSTFTSGSATSTTTGSPSSTQSSSTIETTTTESTATETSSTSQSSSTSNTTSSETSSESSTATETTSSVTSSTETTMSTTESTSSTGSTETSSETSSSGSTATESSASTSESSTETTSESTTFTESTSVSTSTSTESTSTTTESASASTESTSTTTSTESTSASTSTESTSTSTESASSSTTSESTSTSSESTSSESTSSTTSESSSTLTTESSTTTSESSSTSSSSTFTSSTQTGSSSSSSSSSPSSSTSSSSSSTTTSSSSSSSTPSCVPGALTFFNTLPNPTYSGAVAACAAIGLQLAEITPTNIATAITISGGTSYWIFSINGTLPPTGQCWVQAITDTKSTNCNQRHAYMCECPLTLMLFRFDDHKAKACGTVQEFASTGHGAAVADALETPNSFHTIESRVHTVTRATKSGSADSFGRKDGCFVYFGHAMSYFEAKEACHSRRMALVTVTDGNIHKVREIASSNSLWIGAAGESDTEAGCLLLNGFAIQSHGCQSAFPFVCEGNNANL